MSETTDNLEREAEQTRARIADTAESLRNKMTPGQMLDEVTSMLRGGDAEATLMNLKNQMRDNPLPLTLVGAGLAWFFMGGGPSSDRLSSSVRAAAHRRPADRSADFYASGYAGTEAYDESDEDDYDFDPYRTEPDSYRGSVKSEPGLMERSSQMASEAFSSASDAMKDASSAVSESLSGVRRSTADTGGRISRKTTRAASRVSETAGDFFSREPLATAALGLAVGALVGALLPRTETEDEQLGPLSDSVKEEASQMASDGLNQAKDVASEAYGALKEEADRQGLMPGEPKVGETHMADRVSEVIKSAARAGEDAARDRLGTQQQS